MHTDYSHRGVPVKQWFEPQTRAGCLGLLADSALWVSEVACGVLAGVTHQRVEYSDIRTLQVERAHLPIPHQCAGAAHHRGTSADVLIIQLWIPLAAPLHLRLTVDEVLHEVDRLVGSRRLQQDAD